MLELGTCDDNFELEQFGCRELNAFIFRTCLLRVIERQRNTFQILENTPQLGKIERVDCGNVGQ